MRRVNGYGIWEENERKGGEYKREEKKEEEPKEKQKQKLNRERRKEKKLRSAVWATQNWNSHIPCTSPLASLGFHSEVAFLLSEFGVEGIVFVIFGTEKK